MQMIKHLPVGILMTLLLILPGCGGEKVPDIKPNVPDTKPEEGTVTKAKLGGSPEVPPNPTPQKKPVNKAQDPILNPKAMAGKVLQDRLAKDGVHLDLEKKIIRLDGKMWILNSNLEYLVVSMKGKKHESLMVAECKPSSLNAALIFLGMEKGKNFSLKAKVPMPSEEEVKSGKEKPFVVIHPEGPALKINVEWADKEGKVHRHPARDLVYSLKTKTAVKACDWIYFGSRMASLYKGEEPVFMADIEQCLVSVCYMDPSNHLITMKHEDGLSQSNWWPNAGILPEKGTPVKIFFSIR